VWLLQLADLGLELGNALLVQLCLLCLLSQSGALALEGALRDLRLELRDLCLELRQMELSLMGLLQTELWVVSACKHVMRLGGGGGGGGRMARFLSTQDTEDVSIVCENVLKKGHIFLKVP
jgi:hypothetical protein